MKINILSEHIANVIAAGEVVERPASVVKELVENSLDAGAVRIRVEIEDCGRRKIVVDDDGEGMDPEDASRAFIRHATSKIKTGSDLFNIGTLGFRGEALPSIASVSRVLLETANGEQGTILRIEGGAVVESRPGSLRKGTRIEIADLFYNTPARYKFLKSDYTENANTTETIYQLALGHPNVAIELIIDGRQVFKSHGNGNILEIFSQVSGYVLAQNMIEFKGENFEFGVHGWISQPAYTRTNRTGIYTFINQRAVRLPWVPPLLVSAMGDNLAPQRFPSAIVFIELDPQLIDVNVHPTKKEVKLTKEEELREVLFEAVKSLFYQTVATPRIIEKPTADVPVGGVSSPSLDVSTASPPAPRPESEPVRPAANLFEPRPMMVREETDPLDQEQVHFRLLGQFNKTYLVIEKDQTLCLIDQHAAMERINYEMIMEKISSSPLTIGSLFPYAFDVGIGEEGLFLAALAKFQEFGFTFEQFGPRSFRLVEQPSWMIGLDEQQVVQALVEMIVGGQNINVSELLRDKVALIACKASLKANMALSFQEMERLVRDLYRCKAPSTCPHGRPVIITYPLSEIERAFKRSGF